MHPRLLDTLEYDENRRLTTKGTQLFQLAQQTMKSYRFHQSFVQKFIKVIATIILAKSIKIILNETNVIAFFGQGHIPLERPVY